MTVNCGVAVRPNLFVIGAPKCGTTFFHDILLQHPDACASLMKEPFFFQRDDYFESMENYLGLFSHCGGAKVVFESSPIYSETISFPDVPQRIFDLNPEAKIIYLVRSPLDRIRSMWAQALYNGHDKRRIYFDKLMPSEFSDAVFNYPLLLSTTLYWTHLLNYRSVFNDSSIKVIFFEDLVSSPEEVMLDVCRFLGVSSNYPFNFGASKKNPSEEKRHYQPFLEKLSRLRLVKLVNKVVPLASVRRFLYRFSKPVPKHLDLSSRDYERLRSILEPEVRSLLSDQGKPLDFWSV